MRAHLATLANGVLNAEMLRNGLYGGLVDVTALVDVSGDIPKHAFRVDLSADCGRTGP
jgi:hypothetical protein